VLAIDSCQLPAMPTAISTLSSVTNLQLSVSERATAGVKRVARAGRTSGRWSWGLGGRRRVAGSASETARGGRGVRYPHSNPAHCAGPFLAFPHSALPHSPLPESTDVTCACLCRMWRWGLTCLPGCWPCRCASCGLPTTG
jgi:hypothetical protein